MPNENVIDTLKLNIIVNTKQNGQSITTLRNSLEKLYKFLNGVKDQDFSKISNDIAKIGNKLTPLVNAINSLDGQGLKNLTSLGTRLKTVSKNMSEVNAAEFAKKMQTMTTAITPFVDKVVSAEGALRELNKVLADYKTISSNIPKFTPIPKNRSLVATPTSNGSQESIPIDLGDLSVNKKSTSGYKTFNTLRVGRILAKLYFVRNITKQLGENLAKVVQYGMDYEETLNLWQVAMKGNTAEARKFITEMNRAYGISEATLMNYQATFKNMLSSLGGINQEVAYGLSETLSQMALDYASLYNTSIESAMTKFQAVLAGQVRPIRSESGYDITQATLYEVYKDIGGTKSVRQLSETEKRLLRILAVYRQMKDTAVGDYSNTITSTANQTRYMLETIKDIATWIGVGANQWLKQSNILIRINAYLLALKELAKSFAINMGYVEKSEEKAQDPLADMEQDWDGINKQVDEYKGKLLGFDKFQVLSSADTGDSADITAELLKAMQEYEAILSKSNNVALFGDAEKNIKGAYDILKEWGYEYDEQSKQWLKDGKTVKENIEDIAKSIGGLIAFIGLVTKPWMVLVGAIEYAYWTNEDFRDSINQMLTQLGGAGLQVFQAMGELFEAMAPYIATIVENFADIVNLLDELGLLEETIGLIVVGIVAWKNAQALLNIMNFVRQIRDYVTAMKMLRRETLNVGNAMLLPGQSIGKLGSIMADARTQTILFVEGVSLLTDGFMDLQNWSDMSVLERWATVFKIVAGAAFLAAGAIAAFHTSWSVGAAAVAIGGAVSAVTASILSAMEQTKKATDEIGAYANGGLATKGSLFYAGEAGPELVTQTSGGGSTIMNMEQLEDAVARGFIRGAAATQGDEGQQITVNVSGRALFSILVDEAKSNGYELVKVR